MSHNDDLTPQQLSIAQAMELANAHWNAGQAHQAEQICLQVLEVTPLQVDALNLLGLMMHAYGKLDMAVGYIFKACLAPDAQATHYSNLAELYRLKGQLAEGAQVAQRAIEKDPSLVMAWTNLGIILQEAGQFQASLECLEHVVTLQPDAPEAHNNLANTYKRLGDLPRAQEGYEHALALRPNYAEVHSNLAFLLNDLGLLDEAVASATRAIEINPQLADAYLNLAQIELSRQRYTEALHWTNALLRFAPQHPGALTAFALIMLANERYPEAVESARQALAATPNNANAHNALGKALHALGQLEEAEHAYIKAAELPGTVAEEALIARATLLMEIGETETSIAAFAHALERFPDSPRVIAARSETKRYGLDDPDIALMEHSLVSEPGPTFQERISLHFALGKAYLDLGESDRAFSHLHRGNQLKRSALCYDAAHTHAWMKQIQESFPASLFSQLKAADLSTKQSVFIVGMPRSGTTLVEQILASHPDVYGAGELHALSQAVAQAGHFPNDFKHWSNTDLARIGEDYLERVNGLAPAALRVIDKMPGNFLYAGLMPLILPGVRIIHCRRDPIDTCLSCYSKNFAGAQAFSYELHELGQFHCAYQELMAYWRQVLPSECFIEVDYEAVVDDLEAQSRRLIKFINLPWDDACLDFHNTRRIVRTASMAQVREPLYNSSKGRWQQHASHLAPLLSALGMEPS